MPDPTGTNLTDLDVDFLDGRDHGFKRFRLAERIQQLREDLDAMGYDFKGSCVAATTTALPSTAPIVYDNGASGVGATLTRGENGALGAIDGVTLVVGERLLVKNQGGGATHLQNGIYVVTSLGAAGVPYVLTRAEDSDTAAELSPGFTVAVEEGTVNGADGGSVWQHTTNGPITVGTTALGFSRESVDWASVSAALAAATSRADFNEQHILSGGIELEAGALLTIDGGGAILPTHGQHLVANAAAAATDDLDTITATNFVDGGLLFLQGTLGQVTTLRSGVGNIRGPATSDVELGVTASDWALLIYDGTNWHVVAHSRAGVRFGTTEDTLDVSAGGAITPSGVGRVRVDTAADAASDDLDTITATNYLPGQCLVLRPEILNQVVNLTNAGNIVTPNGADIEIGRSLADRVLLMWDGTSWRVLAVAVIAGAGTSGLMDATDKAQIDAAVASSAGAGDAGKFVELDGAGLFSPTFIPLATEGAVGGRELATQAEANAGTDDATILTPLKHAAFVGTETGIRTVKTHAAFAGSGQTVETAAVETTDATTATLWSKTLDDDTAYWFEADIVAREITGAGTSENSYKLRFLASRRAAGAAVAGAAGSVSLYVDEQDLDWAAIFDVNGNDVRLRVTGDAATTSLAWAGTIRWQAVSTVA